MKKSSITPVIRIVLTVEDLQELGLLSDEELDKLVESEKLRDFMCDIEGALYEDLYDEVAYFVNEYELE